MTLWSRLPTIAVVYDEHGTLHRFRPWHLTFWLLAWDRVTRG